MLSVVIPVMQIETETYNGIYIAIAVLQLIGVGIAVWNIRLQRKQVKGLLQQVQLQTAQVKIQGDAIYIESFAHFSSMYQDVMKNVPQNATDTRAIKSWWYRYWDILISEVSFHTRGYIDPVVFELWMNELVRNWHMPPQSNSHMGTFGENGVAHFERILNRHNGITVFFDEIVSIAAEQSDLKRGQRIHELVLKTHKTAPPG